MTDIVEMCDMVASDGMIVAMLDRETGEFRLADMSPKTVRAYIQTLASVLMRGETKELEVKHTFLDGMYMRELFIPKGTVLIGKVHKLACINLVTQGDISILTETGSARVKAGFSIVSPSGLQKVGYAHEDTVFVNVFRTDETDPEKIEKAIALEGETSCPLLG